MIATPMTIKTKIFLLAIPWLLKSGCDFQTIMAIPIDLIHSANEHMETEFFMQSMIINS